MATVYLHTRPTLSRGRFTRFFTLWTEFLLNFYRPFIRRQRRALSDLLEYKLPTEVQMYAFYSINQINNLIKEWNKFYLTKPIFYKTMLTVVNYIHTFNFVLIESHQLISFSINFPYIFFVMLTGLQLLGSPQFPFWKSSTILVLIQDLSYYWWL